MEKEKEGFDFERFKQEAISGLYAGQKLHGDKGVFGPLIKHLLESALEGELSHHLEEEKAAGLTNRRNGKSRKKIKSSAGELEVSPNSVKVTTSAVAHPETGCSVQSFPSDKAVVNTRTLPFSLL